MSIDVAIVNAVLAGIRHLFDHELKTPVTLGKAQLRPADSSPQKHWALIMTLDLTGAVSGRVSLCFPAATARAIIEAIRHAPVESFDEECLSDLLRAGRTVVQHSQPRISESGTTIQEPRLARPMATSKAAHAILAFNVDSAAGRLSIEFEVEASKVESGTQYRAAG